MSAPSRSYNDLPDNVLDFLNDIEGINVVGGLIKKYGGVENSEANLLHLVDQIALGTVQIVGVPDAVGTYMGLDAEKARQAAGELVLARILPIADSIGIDARGTLQSWGVDPARFTEVRQVKLEQDPRAIEETPARLALLDVGAVFSDPVLQHRLELVVASFRDGVRTREQAIAVMRRPIKTGGLEMSEKAAGDVLDLAGEKVEPNEPKEPGAGAKNPSVPLTSPQPSPFQGEGGAVKPINGGAKADAFTVEDEAEVKQVAEAKKAAMETPALITDTKAAAEKIATDAKLTFATGEIKTRFEHIIDARLRDVRDGFETRAKLEAPVDQGGLGLAGVQLVAVVEAAENMDAMHHKALAAEMAKKKDELMAKKAEGAKGAEETAQKEAQVMAKRYAEITGKAPTELVAPTPSRPTAAPVAQTVEQREQQIDTAKVRAAIEAAKTPTATVRAVMSPASIPATPSGRPKVEDVRFERKLAGPIEELRLLTLVDFRRLSKDPTQATRKIQDKVELVAQEGYDRRIAAIRAWRESPLSQQYVALSREALIAGKGIGQVLAEKRASGEDVPTDEELKAVVDLNATLRF